MSCYYRRRYEVQNLPCSDCYLAPILFPTQPQPQVFRRLVKNTTITANRRRKLPATMVYYLLQKQLQLLPEFHRTHPSLPPPAPALASLGAGVVVICCSGAVAIAGVVLMRAAVDDFCYCGGDGAFCCLLMTIPICGIVVTVVCIVPGICCTTFTHLPLPHCLLLPVVYRVWY